MALRFVDGFDHYATADIALKWTAAVSGTISASGRNGSCLSTSGSSSYVTLTLDAQATWTIGVAFQCSSIASDNDFLRLYDGSTLHVSLRTNATSGTLSLLRGGSVLLASSVSAVNPGTWYYVEFKTTISDTGTYQVKVNGVDWIASASGDTRATGGAATANVIWLGLGTSNAGTHLFDDVYIADGQDGINDFLGDVKVTTLLPAAAGNSAQFSRSAGADNYALVDEASQDGDTTYNYSSTADHVDTFDMATCTAATVLATQECLMARKDDSGARTIATVCRSGGADDPGTTESPGTSYVCYRNIREVDPNTDAAWTTANLNAAEFGYKVVA